MSSIKKVSDKLYDFATGLVGNRVFDLYLKYMGITTLSTASLVPIALLTGKDAFESVVMKVKTNKGKGLPIIDDPLIGNALKITGLTAMSLTIDTLVPLGVVMFIYNLATKGENQKGGSLNKYVKRIYGNRILDLFLKYQGIKTLNSATLVPFALILGRDALEKVLKDEQVGGFIPKQLPIVDDPLFGNFLKLSGLTMLTLTPNTLVPLGVLAVLYNIYYEGD
jgi:hypothetical protein